MSDPKNAAVFEAKEARRTTACEALQEISLPKKGKGGGKKLGSSKSAPKQPTGSGSQTNLAGGSSASVPHSDVQREAIYAGKRIAQADLPNPPKCQLTMSAVSVADQASCEAGVQRPPGSGVCW